MTHLDHRGAARMVDVGEKAETERLARARAVVRMEPGTARLVAEGDLPKGDVVATARLAAIGAAKRTDELIPLAHSLALTSLDAEVSIDGDAGTVTIECVARTRGRTGVEMEAMLACAVGALTIYDMVKAVERGVRVESVELLEKSGGRHDWSRGEAAGSAGPDGAGDPATGAGAP